ncbi:mechanosensitive ion channel family protein [Clostridium sp. LIBA-8841]|uniref:mechanosensitive ion channel family protein n=1 Tax=Clostridium sp. LIBA-8841 TaxID=2987530 RepID=UPI002AC7D5DE|nr:mechanosensitive ion channel family protein [Clostridium sp. LIBA-8841]MDZ5255253.1 mechanosensitive ion channel family protein [Clostridium sp. LIBA-8841]
MKEIESLFERLALININEIIIILVIMLIVLITNKILITNLFKLLRKGARKTKNYLDNNIVRALENPLKLFVSFIGIYSIFKVINVDLLGLDFFSTYKIIRVGIIASFIYFAYNLTLENSLLYSKLHKNDSGNTIVFPFLSIVIRLVILLVGIIIIANEFGLTGFIAGLGVSGVAFALAAQDTFSNLFGGMVIVLDRPFSIGDWIQAGDVEGLVEEITFRSTKIRTFSMALATVPNSKLANSNIINWTQRKLRRIHFKFTMDCKTSIESIKNSVNKIENMLREHDKIDKNLIIVSFNELSTYGFRIFIYFYTDQFEYLKYEKLKEEININILEILREESVDLMFLNFDFKGFDRRGDTCNFESTELESIKNITEEERGV